ncbi:MAG: pheromone autoinducer 2 transporter [bacterium ADurb.Bin429]|nr:MAG: pheromone autoinducer 2 transporter [bacterium ADurb.Bin429]
MQASSDTRPMRLVAFGIALVALVVILFITAPLVWSVLQLFIIVALLVLALEPPVRWLTARRVPRGGAVALVVLATLALIILFFALVVPRIIEQIQQLFQALPGFWAQLTTRAEPWLRNYPQLAEALSPDRFFGQLSAASSALLSAASSIFASAVGALTALLLALVATIYALLRPLPLVFGLRGLFPSTWWPKVDSISAAIATRIRGWVLGTVALAIIIGALDYLALWIINLLYEPDIPYIMTFAVIGGVLEIVPVVGPIIATVLPAIAGFSLDPMLGLFVILAFFIVQQLENHLIVPLVMHQAVNLHPVSLLFALVVLSGLFGLFGAIIAVPVAAVFKVLYDEWYYPMMHDGRAPLSPPDEASLIKHSLEDDPENVPES